MKVKKRHVTLIEMMIVMFLIALIVGVVGYNSRGSLDEGKAFKTKMAIEKIEAILNLRIAEEPSVIESLSSNWTTIVEHSPLSNNGRAMSVDGWGNQFQVSLDSNNSVLVESEALKNYEAKKRGR